MISLLAMCPNVKDATSLYRGSGPLSQLRKQVSNLEICYATEFNWAVIQSSDVVFMQRPYSAMHLKLAKMIKDNQIPLWLDYDDDLFSVPADNPTQGLYASEETRRNVATLIAMADQVTVSTNELGRRLQKITGQKPTTVPNAFNEAMFPYREAPSAPRNNLASWRGSNTHQKDVLEYTPAILSAAKRNPNWSWQFIGYKPWFLTDALKKAHCFEVMDPVDYHRFLHDTHPSIQIVPLHDSPFNRSKSNIAWIEATFAGAACVVPEWEEWKMPGAVTYRNAKDFEEAIDGLANRSIDLQRCQKDSWEHVQENFLLSKVNRIRKTVIEKLLDREPRVRQIGEIKLGGVE